MNVLPPIPTNIGSYLLRNAVEVNLSLWHRSVKTYAFQVVPEIGTTFHPIQKWLFLRRNVVKVLAGTKSRALFNNKFIIHGTQTFVLRPSGPSADFLDEFVDSWPI